MHLQAGGRSGGPARRVLRFSAFLSAAGQHRDRGEWGAPPPPPPQTAPQRNYFFLPQTAPAATDRPAAQLLPPQTAPQRS